MPLGLDGTGRDLAAGTLCVQSRVPISFAVDVALTPLVKSAYCSPASESGSITPERIRIGTTGLCRPTPVDSSHWHHSESRVDRLTATKNMCDAAMFLASSAFQSCPGRSC